MTFLPGTREIPGSVTDVTNNFPLLRLAENYTPSYLTYFYREQFRTIYTSSMKQATSSRVVHKVSNTYFVPNASDSAKLEDEFQFKLIVLT